MALETQCPFRTFYAIEGSTGTLSLEVRNPMPVVLSCVLRLDYPTPVKYWDIQLMPGENRLLSTPVSVGVASLEGLVLHAWQNGNYLGQLHFADIKTVTADGYISEVYSLIKTPVYTPGWKLIYQLGTTYPPYQIEAYWWAIFSLEVRWIRDPNDMIGRVNAHLTRPDGTIASMFRSSSGDGAAYSYAAFGMVYDERITEVGAYYVVISLEWLVNPECVYPEQPIWVQIDSVTVPAVIGT